MSRGLGDVYKRQVSEADFVEMRDRLRVRAMRLMRQLEGGGIYRQQIEREVAARAEDGRGQAGAAAPASPAVADAGTCVSCGTTNDRDARFCKQCGERVSAEVNA